MIRLKKIGNYFFIITILAILGSFSCIGFWSDDAADLANETVKEDSFEFDNAVSDAKTISVGTSGIQERTIHESGDIDFIEVILTADKNYRVNLSAIKGFEPELSIYDIDGISIIEQKNTGYYTGLFDWWGYDNIRNFEILQKESIIFTPSATGSYYISVKDIYDAHSNGTYKLKVEEVVVINQSENLTAIADSPNLKIDLQWAKIPAVDGYNIYRNSDDSVDFNQFKLIGSVSTAEIAFYSDSDILLDTTYSYVVTGFIGELQGNPSNIAKSAISIDLRSPEDLQVTPVNAYIRNELTWSPEPIVDGYNIYRAEYTQRQETPINDDFVLITSVDSNTVTFTDNAVEPNKQYFYFVTSTLLNNESTQRYIVSAYIDWLEFRPTSSIISASEGQKGKIVITLESKFANTGIQSYQVYRSDSSSGEPGLFIGDFLANASIGNKITDLDVSSGVYYYYCVKIVMIIDGVSVSSNYSYFDSGIASE